MSSDYSEYSGLLYSSGNHDCINAAKNYIKYFSSHLTSLEILVKSIPEVTQKVCSTLYLYNQISLTINADNYICPG